MKGQALTPSSYNAISMLVLALDTTTRRGSVALTRDADLLDLELGDPALTHGQRLPGDIIRLLGRQRVSLGDIDLFAVAAGPGSFTGLRIGIAAMQGLALANGRGILGVSALDALRASAPEAGVPSEISLVGAWMDAHRGEIFASLYRGQTPIDEPAVSAPPATLERWEPTLAGKPVAFIGDGALAYADVIRAALPSAVIVPSVPPLAPAIARLARDRAGDGITPPHALRPLYVRRPDAELARDRTRCKVDD
jgi:tRNA threonylcarbamoyladenosine biosynthesis protein TsaB